MPELTYPNLTARDLEDDFDDAAADRWNDGALAAIRGRARSSADPDYRKGYAEGLELRKVRPVMVERPEGYYHAPLGAFGEG